MSQYLEDGIPNHFLQENTQKWKSKKINFLKCCPEKMQPMVQ
jgi:hypothetical protein